MHSLVVDADGLFLIAQNLTLIRGYTPCILTPNAMEFTRLVDTAILECENMILGHNNQIEESNNYLITAKYMLNRLKSEDVIVQLQALAHWLQGMFSILCYPIL